MEMPKKCIICGITEKYFQIGEPAGPAINREYLCRCDRCGEYFTTHRVLKFIQGYDKTRWYALSGLIREMNKTDERPSIGSKDIEKLLNDPRIPKQDEIQRKAIRILSHLREKTEFFGEKLIFDTKMDYPIAYAKNADECKALINLLLEQDLLERHTSDLVTVNLRSAGADPRHANVLSLTSGAYEMFRSGELSNRVFIAARFTDEHDTFIEAMKDGVSEAGFEPKCLRKEEFPERIMDRALFDIAGSKYIIVDVTDGTFNIGLEAGYALALGKELIFVQRVTDAQEKRPFYSGHYQIREYKDASELREKVENAIRMLESRKSPE